MHEVRVPRLNANDDEYILTGWVAGDGATVDRGSLIAEVETSKATAELLADAPGQLQHVIAVGGRCRPGDVVARLRSASSPVEPREDQPAVAPDHPLPLSITRSARALMDANGLSEADLRGLGKALVKSDDVRQLLISSSSTPSPTRAESTAVAPSEHSPPGLALPLSRNQAAVARAVSLAAATIPAAFTVMKVPAEAVRQEQALLREAGRGTVGHVEFVVIALAATLVAHPKFAASERDGRAHVPAERPIIGVTVDVGTGLFIVAVPLELDDSAEKVSQHLLRARKGALRGTLTEVDLGSPDITVTVHTTPGVIMAQPIIFPGQTSALSVCAMDDELVMDDDASISKRAVFSVGVAFDHRFINGADASAFLSDLRSNLESRQDARLQR